MTAMDFNEAFAKRRMMDLLKIDKSPAVIAKNDKIGDHDMEPFDGKTSAEKQVEEIAKRAHDNGQYATLQKARAAAWLDNPELYDQYTEEARSPAFLAKLEKRVVDARITKGGDRYTEMKSTAEVQLDVAAKKYASEHSVSFAKAYDAVLRTADGQRLYAEHRAA